MPEELLVRKYTKKDRSFNQISWNCKHLSRQKFIKANQQMCKKLQNSRKPFPPSFGI